MLLGLLRFVKEGICAHGTEGVRASVCSKSSQLQCRLRLEGICGIRRRAIEQARLLRLLLRVRSESTKTERILLRLLGVARVRSRSKPAASKDVCWLLLLLLRLLGIARVRSRSKPAPKDVCWLLLLLLLRLLRLSEERLLVWLLSLLGVLPKSTKDTLLLLWLVLILT